MTSPHPPARGAPQPEANDGGSGEPYRLLFVCTGNTCRSPLAEVLARRAVARLGWEHVEVRSAGVAAQLGGPASEGSLRAASRHGMDLSAHRSRPLTQELVRWADLVLTMSPGHLPAVHMLHGGAKAAVITDFAEGGEPRDGSSGAGILDPVGGDDAEYEDTLRQLDALVDRVLERLTPLVNP